MIKLAPLQICKELMFSELINDPAYYFYVYLTQIFNINQNIVQVHYNKNVGLFNQNFDNIAFKASETIGKSEKYDWVLKIAISSLK